MLPGPRPLRLCLNALPTSVSSTQHDASASSAALGSGRTTSLVASLPWRRLSPAEMAQRCADGLCYNCDKKFVLVHRCKKLFIIDIVGFDYTKNSTDDSASPSA